MRCFAICFLVVVGGSVLASAVSSEVPQLINYQGILTDLSGTRIDGTHDLTFRIYAGADPGSPPLWTEVHAGVLINEGLFSVILGGTEPFPADLFGDGERWVGIAVDSDAEIVPRMKLVSVPWALRAARADSVLSVSGGTVDGHSLDAVDGDPVNAVYVNEEGKVGVGTTSPGAKLHIKSDGEVQRWEGPANKGYWAWTPGVLGNDVILRPTPVARLLIAGDLGVGSDPDAMAEPRVVVVGANGDGRALRLRSAFGDGTVPGDAAVFLVQDDSHSELFRVQENGYVGVRTPNPDYPLDVVGMNGYGRVLRLRSAFAAGSVPENAAVLVVEDDTPLELFRVQENGLTRVKVLEITGGSDLVEPFPVDDVNPMAAGMVVSIDPRNPGDLILASEPYDHKVAGIISGANGLGPGMVMSNIKQNHEGSKVNVALSGRVWCWADASNGPITPGDLLTTSETLGHAMKVIERRRAQGAVLGKAMSSLESGRGLVLVLVSLQ